MKRTIKNKQLCTTILLWAVGCMEARWRELVDPNDWVQSITNAMNKFSDITAGTILTADLGNGVYHDVMANGINNVSVFSTSISSYYEDFCDNYNYTPSYQPTGPNNYYDYKWIDILDFFDLLTDY